MDRTFASRVRAVIESERPANVDPESVFQAGEGGEVEIVLVPHRQMGGFSLGVWCEAERLDVFWRPITDLSTHDQIDLAVRVLRLEGRDRIDEAVTMFGEELRRPIRVTAARRWGRTRVKVAIDLGTGDKSWHLMTSRASLPAEQETSLSAGTLRGINRPVPLAEWRKFA